MTGNERPCPDDLIVRARRREISELERRALDAHLAQCDVCRATSAVTALFDAIPENQPGDSRLIARVANKTLRAGRSLRWNVLRVAAIVALVMLTGGVAIGAWIVHRANPRKVDRPSQEANAIRAPGHTQGRSNPAAQLDLPSPPQSPVPTAGEAKQGVELERKRRPSQRLAEMAPTGEVAPNPPEPTPASLFAQANALRHTGEVRKAISLYEVLRQRFPDSEQAHMSAISQGDLLLAEGELAKAIAAYGAYLHAVPHGALAEEALYGKARGQGLLGQSGEERRTWEELARRFPHSTYYPAALRRLRELAP